MYATANQSVLTLTTVQGPSNLHTYPSTGLLQTFAKSYNRSSETGQSHRPDHIGPDWTYMGSFDCFICSTGVFTNALSLCCIAVLSQREAPTHVPCPVNTTSLFRITWKWNEPDGKDKGKGASGPIYR